ncbi:transcriptional regulator [Mannheimia haemolytica]|uniref:transcriptional regulator n=1 Tax=Mannheimia haemolytica TaxID=75985 RepID=UPI00201BA297|nr:transcriptional regulator [Mannheimia haemolytica]UQX78654.1 transcriptional regulator [Mannheimia haemolytica]
MAGLSIICPFCGNTARIRGSSRPSLLSYQAQLTCSNCGQLKADFVGQLINIKRAVFIECDEANQWDKPENELIKEGKIQGKDNAQRLKELRGSQQDLFANMPGQLPPEKITSAEKIAKRESLSKTH